MTVSIPALGAKADFLGLEEVAHLAAGGETPPLRSQGAAMLRWVELKGRGPAGGAERAAVTHIHNARRRILARQADA